MKHVNFDPEMELKKSKIMEEFNQGNGPGDNDATQGESAENLNLSDEELIDKAIDALKTVYDPEIPVNIYDLGLIYKVDIKQGFAEIDMTLTAPGCPVAETFPGMGGTQCCVGARYNRSCC